MIAFPSLFVVATYLGSNIGEGFPHNVRTPNRCELLRLHSESSSDNNLRLRKKKRNKYEEYSSTDKLEKDPLDTLIDESLLKIKSLEKSQIRHDPKNDHVSTEAVGYEPLRPTFPDNKNINPYDPTTYGFVELGKVIGAHGVHGFVKIAAVTTFPERLCKPGIRHLKAPNRRSPRQIQLIEGRKISNSEYLIRLDGVKDRDAAMKLRDFTLYSRQEERPNDIAADEYLIADLVGMDIMLTLKGDQETHKNNYPIGKISGVVFADEMCSIPGLGNDLLEVLLVNEGLATPSWREKFVLIPFVPAIVPFVDMRNSIVYIDPPSGLLDLSYTHEENYVIKGFLPGSVDGS